MLFFLGAFDPISTALFIWMLISLAQTTRLDLSARREFPIPPWEPPMKAPPVGIGPES